MLKSIITAIILAACASASYADDWQFFTTGVSGSTTGVAAGTTTPPWGGSTSTPYVYTPFALASTNANTFTLIESDSEIDNFGTGVTWSNTTGIQIYDSNGNSVCNAASESTEESSTWGTATIKKEHWQETCNANTLTANTLYYVRTQISAWCAFITGGSCATRPPQFAMGYSGI